MKKIGIFYGSTTGTTARIASKIAERLGVSDADIMDVAEIAPDRLGDYDVIVAGTSTWGDGEMQEDWYDFLDGAEVLDLKDKKFAVFGCGDDTMSETFCNGIGELYRRLKSTGTEPIGEFNEEGFSFTHSGAAVDGKVVGLVLDEVNHPDLTDMRISEWTDEIKRQI